MEKNFKHISKLLSLVLRHEPQRIGITLNENGWTSVAELLRLLNLKGIHIDLNTLETIVQTNDKKRYSFSDDKTMIRANQGHSVPVDLQLEEKVPPYTLYHGTPVQHVAAIKREGLKKQERHHVHLSESVEQATAVGSRRGKPFIFRIKAMEMYEAGHRFYLSANHVWLTAEVPADYLIG